MLEQYLLFLRGTFTGELGTSFVFGRPAIQVIVERMPATLELAALAMLISVAIGIPLGLYAGLRPNSTTARAIMAGSIVGFSLPTFWVGLILILVFAVQLGWLPSGGRGPTTEVLGLQLSILNPEGLRYALLPALNLALFKLSLIIRLTRAQVREQSLLDYIKFARAKGLPARRVIGVHLLKNILIPLVTVIGLELGSVIAFAVVTETIFAWPGMGKLVIDSIFQLDRPVVVAYLLLIVTMFILINLVVDILYSIARSARAAGGDDVDAGDRPRPRVALAPLQPQFAESRLALFGLALLCLVIAIALLAPWISPQNPYDLGKLDLLDARLPPGERAAGGALLHGDRYVLGTDGQGRDMLSAIFYGLRVSLYVGAASGVVALTLGTLLGVLAAYAGGRFEQLLMRLVDIQLGFPAILVALILLAVLGKGVDKIIIALVAVQWAYYARTARSAALVERNKEYMEAARALGLPQLAHRAASPAAQRAAAADRRRHGAGRARDRARGDAVVPRPRPADHRALAGPADRQRLRVPALGQVLDQRSIRASRCWSTILSINLVGDQLRDVLNPRLSH